MVGVALCAATYLIVKIQSERKDSLWQQPVKFLFIEFILVQNLESHG